MINENQVHVSTIDDMQVSMDEMNSKYEGICTSADLVSKENQVISGDYEMMKLSNTVLQEAKDKVKKKWNAVQSKNEAIVDERKLLLEKISSIEE